MVDHDGSITSTEIGFRRETMSEVAQQTPPSTVAPFHVEPPPAPTSRRDRMVEAVAHELEALLEQARQQRRPTTDAVAHFVGLMLDAASELAYTHVLEQARARIAERERVEREAQGAGALLRTIDGAEPERASR
jgi:hypothetical protein